MAAEYNGKLDDMELLADILFQEILSDAPFQGNPPENTTDCLSVSSFNSNWMLWDKNKLDRQGTKNY